MVVFMRCLTEPVVMEQFGHGEEDLLILDTSTGWSFVGIVAGCVSISLFLVTGQDKKSMGSIETGLFNL